MKSEPDSTFQQTDQTDVQLGNYLSRPIKHNLPLWTINGGYNHVFNPWNIFFSNKRVANRISNYNLLSCTLHVRFTISGSPMHYGKIMISYLPLRTNDEFEQYIQLNTQECNVILSQRQHVVLDPNTAKGAILVLPFLYPTPKLSLPSSDFLNMGQLNMSALSALRHANNAADSVEITCHIWAEQVQVSVPTQANLGGLTPQSGMENESDKPITKIATVIQHIAGELQQVPSIAPYALATENIASRTASVARSMGFSRPSYPEQIPQIISRTMPNIANTNIHDTAHKLSLDCRQETTVDPRILALNGEDELSIKHIASKPSYLTTFPWSSTTPTDSTVFSARITPILFQRDASAFGGRHYLTAMAFASLPFEYWRGSIYYKFIVVATPFHRGKLMIKYDPRNFAAATRTETNLQYTHVLDLEETRELTLKIGWGQHPSYNRIPQLYLRSSGPPAPLAIPFNTTGGFAYDNTSNGVLEVVVLNKLSAPTIGATIDILVYAYAGEDFEVFEPTTRNLNHLSQFTPQSGSEDVHPNMDHQIETICHSAEAPQLSIIHHGDPVISFRQLLKRYELHRVTVTALNDYALVSHIRSDFPIYRGNAPGAQEIQNPSLTPADTRLWNAVKLTTLNYITPAFVCRRGGMRHLISHPLRRPGWGGPMNIVKYSRSAFYSAETNFVLPLIDHTTPANASTIAREILRNISAINGTGQVLHAMDKDAQVAYEIPYSSPLRFLSARKANYHQPEPNGDMHEITFYSRADASSRDFLAHYVAVAEDFQLSHYVGPPVLWVQQSFTEVPP